MKTHQFKALFYMLVAVFLCLVREMPADHVNPYAFAWLPDDTAATLSAMSRALMTLVITAYALVGWIHGIVAIGIVKRRTTTMRQGGRRGAETR